MYIVPIAWIYVALMMAVAEGANSNGSVLGAIVTFLLYGVGPVALLVYFMGTPARKRAIKAKEAQELAQLREGLPEALPQPSGQPSPQPSDQSLLQPDAGGHAPAATQRHVVAPVRKEP